MSLLDDMKCDAENQTPNEADLSHISMLAERIVMLEVGIEDHMNVIQGIKDELERVRTKDLPDAMRAAGMAKFTLADGREVSVEDKYYPSITAANQAVAYNQLRESGNGSIIKNTITIVLGRDQDQKAEAVCDMLENAGVEFSRKEAIPAQTLKAFVREMKEAGEELPSAITVFEQTEASVKMPRKTRKSK